MPARFLLFAFSLLVLAPAAQAQLGLLAYGGYNSDAENALIGGGFDIGLPMAGPVALSIRSTAEYAFPSDILIADRVFSRDILQGNVDIVARFGAGGLQPFAGAGLAIMNVALDTSDNDAVEGDLDSSETNVGANLFAGANLGQFGPIQPFVQARVTLGSDTAFSGLGGLRLGF